VSQLFAPRQLGPLKRTRLAHAGGSPPVRKHDGGVRRAVAAGAGPRVQLQVQVRAGLVADVRPLHIHIRGQTSADANKGLIARLLLMHAVAVVKRG